MQIICIRGWKKNARFRFQAHIPKTIGYSGYAINTANKLRQNNINTEIYFDDKKIKAKFKYYLLPL